MHMKPNASVFVQCKNHNFELFYICAKFNHHMSQISSSHQDKENIDLPSIQSGVTGLQIVLM